MSQNRMRTVPLAEPVGRGADNPVEATPRPNHSGLDLLFTALAAALAVWIVATTVAIARTGWSAVPLIDDWDRWVTYVYDHRSWYWFFRQHADHRLVGPKVLFEIDRVFFQGRGW